MTTNLMDASRQLTNRPADEHFADFASMKQAARFDRDHSRTVELPLASLIVRAGSEGLLLGRNGGDNAFYPMTFHGARAVARHAGASPDFVFGRLSPETAALALTEGLQRSPDSIDKVQLLIGTVSKADGSVVSPRVRAITSPSYRRVWDADVLEEIDRWLIPHGFKPALPTKNTDAQKNNIMGNNKPALFRGGADSFAFFMHEEGTGGAGDRPIRRGLMFRNSEIGTAALAPTRFIFDDMCANFIIWGAKAISSLRIIHRGRSDTNLLRRFRDELRQITPTVAAQELDVLNKAAVKVFAPSVEKAGERLNAQFGLSTANAKLALERAAWSENRGTKTLTHAWVANGVTSLAKETTFADNLVELATIGGDIYLAGAV